MQHLGRNLRRENAAAYPRRLFDIENQKDVCDGFLARPASNLPMTRPTRPALHPQGSSRGYVSATVAPQTVIFIWMFGSLSIFPVHVKGHHYGGGDLFGRAE